MAPPPPLSNEEIVARNAQLKERIGKCPASPTPS